jgi:hypothetical protein
MYQVTYTNMVQRHGRVKAFDLLRSMETLAKVDDKINLATEETRFQRALEALNNIDFAAEAAQ